MRRGIVAALLMPYRSPDKLEFSGDPPLDLRAQCGGNRFCPYPLGIVTAQINRNLNFWCGSTQSLPPGGRCRAQRGERGYCTEMMKPGR